MRYCFVLLVLFLLNACADTPVPCQDLLERYGEKIDEIKFVSCKPGSNQTLLTAKYKVAGEDADRVEQFLIDTYGIGKLKFNCCGWESTNGQNGYIDNATLKKQNPYYVLEISMFANAEKEDEEGRFYIEKEKSKLDFYVMVKLLEI